MHTRRANEDCLTAKTNFFFPSHVNIDEKMLQRSAEQYSKRAHDVEAITACEDPVFPRVHEADPSCQLFHVFCTIQSIFS